jgi:hypothetical protein
MEKKRDCFFSERLSCAKIERKERRRGVFYSKYVSFCSIAENNPIAYSAQLASNIDHSTWVEGGRGEGGAVKENLKPCS